MAERSCGVKAQAPSQGEDMKATETQVFYLETPDGLRCLWQSKYQIKDNGLSWSWEIPETQMRRATLWPSSVIEECSPYKEGQDLPPRECIDCKDMKPFQTNLGEPDWSCPTCDGSWHRNHTAGPVTLIRPMDIVANLYEIMTSNREIRSNTYLCMTTPIPQETKTNG